MRFIVRPSIVLVVFWFNAAAAQEGYLGHDMTSGTAAFTKRYCAPILRLRAATLRTAAPPQGSALTTTTR
jgi:hypothetical protein